jgi:hypothetical protein
VKIDVPSGDVVRCDAMSTPLKTAYPPVARNLRYLAQQAEIKWVELARELEVGEKLLWTWRTDGQPDPSWPNVCRLAERFNVNPDWFYRDNPESRDA